MRDASDGNSRVNDRSWGQRHGRYAMAACKLPLLIQCTPQRETVIFSFLTLDNTSCCHTQNSVGDCRAPLSRTRLCPSRRVLVAGLPLNQHHPRVTVPWIPLPHSPKSIAQRWSATDSRSSPDGPMSRFGRDGVRSVLRCKSSYRGQYPTRSPDEYPLQHDPLRTANGIGH